MSERDGEETFSVDDVEAIRETGKALLCVIDGEHVWVPKSQVHEDSEVYSMKSNTGRLVVTMWWAEKQGIA